MRYYQHTLIGLSLIVALVPDASAQVQPDAELRLDQEGYRAMLDYRRAVLPQAAAFSLPTLRAYNRKGEEVLSVMGFEREGFADTLDAAAHLGRPSTPAFSLSGELAPARDARGRAADADDLLAANLTIVEYWSEWCVPCHAQAAAVAEYVAARADLDVSWIKIEADLAAFHEEATGQEVHVLGRGKKTGG